MKTNDTEKLLKKSKLAKAYNELPDIQHKVQIQQELELLLKSSICNDRMLNKHLVYSILPAVAFYRVLEVNTYNKDTILNIISASIFAADRNLAGTFQKLGKLPFFFSLFRIMCRSSLKYVYGKTGWDMRWIVNNSREIKWNCHSCFYDKELKKCGVPDLTRIFCQSDDLVYGNIPGIEWKRGKTIGNGDEICDFGFSNEAKTKSRQFN
jgi:hypothetical protein